MALGKRKEKAETKVSKISELKANEEEIIEVATGVNTDEDEVVADENEVSKEVVVKEESKVAVMPPIKAGKFKFIVDEFKDAFEPVEWGTIPKIVAKSGAFFDSDKKSLGTEIEFTLLSFNDTHLIAPNTNDSADRKLCRYSYDGEVLNDGSGTTVKEYLQSLKDDGYEDASVKQYLEVNVVLNDAGEDNDNIGNMVQLSLSPESVKQFKAYKMQSTVKAARGIIKPNQVADITAKAKNIVGNFTYTIFTFRCTHE